MRVVHVCAYFAPAFVYGGPPRSVLGLCRAERDAGIDVRVVTTTANGDSELDDSASRPVDYAGIPVRYCARSRPRRLFYAPALQDAVAAELQQADVLHIHGLWNAAVWTAARTAWRLRKPYVLSPRGMLTPAALTHHRWRKKLAFSVADRNVIRHAARLHATSFSECQALNCIPERGRAVFVPNGIELDPLTPNGPSIRRQLNAPDDAPLVLFLGRIHPIKRLDLLAEAFATVIRQHPTARLVIAGPDEHGHRAVVEPLFASFSNSVTWTGKVDDAVKRQLLDAADAVVMCSDSESFGMSVAEAMAVGTPVVVTRTCPWPDVESHATGYWVDQNSESIGGAINSLLADPDAANEMGRRGKALIASRYTWQHAAAALIREYEAIAR
jgi:glycosyltransferase involved in cell wall biosynthesis